MIARLRISAPTGNAALSGPDVVPSSTRAFATCDGPGEKYARRSAV